MKAVGVAQGRAARLGSGVSVAGRHRAAQSHALYLCPHGCGREGRCPDRDRQQRLSGGAALTAVPLVLPGSLQSEPTLNQCPAPPWHPDVVVKELEHSPGRSGAGEAGSQCQAALEPGWFRLAPSPRSAPCYPRGPPSPCDPAPGTLGGATRPCPRPWPGPALDLRTEGSFTLREWISLMIPISMVGL